MKLKSRYRTAACLLLLAGLSQSALAEVRLFNKPNPLTGGELKAQLAQVNEVFKTEITAAKTGEQKNALAQKLLAAAREDKDSNAKYALLLRARDIAAESGDLELAFIIVAETDKEFEVSAVKLKIETATSAAKNATTADLQVKFLKICAAEITAAIAAEDFATAKQYSALDVSVAKLTGDKQVFTDTLARLDQIREVEAASIEAKNSAAILATNPNDGERNLKAGRYLCLYKRDWEKGLPMLAKASDPALKAAAVLDTGQSSTSEDMIKIGDAWWDVATPLKDTTRRSAQQRAVAWYKQAVEGMATGLSKTRLEKRIAEYEGSLAGTAITIASNSKQYSSTLKFREQDCVGTWILGKGPGHLIVRADHTAGQSKNTAVTGQWELVNGEIRILYSNGWRNHIVPNGDKFVMNAYAPRSKMTDPPFESREIGKETK